MILRKTLLLAIEQSVESNAVTAILGPRQCGKTTISREFSKGKNAIVFDLDNPVDYRSLTTAPYLTLESISGLVVIDEVQRVPELMSMLRVLVDREHHTAKYLILGSASPVLLKNASESLAGRIGFVDMEGFNLEETGGENIEKLWFRGGFPRSYLAVDDTVSFQWRQDYIRTFLERDIPQLGINIPSESLRRFWTMLAHFHGRVWNANSFGRSLGTSEHTARRYLDILTGAYVVRQIQPWFVNTGKRQVKSPKIYIRDSGLLHALLMLEGAAVKLHHEMGFSWEGFIIEQVISQVSSPVYFWATHAGSELDLLTHVNGQAIGFEIKYSDAPGITKSMLISINDLNLKKLLVIYPGNKSYALTEKIDVIPSKILAGFDLRRVVA